MTRDLRLSGLAQGLLMLSIGCLAGPAMLGGLGQGTRLHRRVRSPAGLAFVSLATVPVFHPR